MAHVIRMPRLSDTMEEGNIVEWLKKVGDSVKPGDILAEVETDKATMELENYHAGVLLYIGEEGSVPVDGVIAVIGEKGEDFEQLIAEENTAQEVVEEEPAPTPSPREPVEVASATVAAPAVTSSSNGRIKASPLAKSMAKEKGIDLADVQGTGDGGRIIKKDIESYTPSQQSSATMVSPSAYATTSVEYGDKPLTQMRKVIARRLGESKFSAPHFYLTVEINMDNAVKARTELKEAQIRVSYNDIVLKACAAALRKHPEINSSWLGDKIRVNQEVNIGVAVAVPDGLLVPVIKHADAKSLSYINQEVRELAGKAKEKKLQPEEMQGNTFTISNLGMFDIEEFTAIINPPDACILAVGSIIEKPIVKNGQIVVGNMMKVTLSCDHRVVDGAMGAGFLQTLKANLENPLRMLA